MSDDTDDNIVQLSIVKPGTPELMIEVSDNPADGVISILEEMLERAKNGQMIEFVACSTDDDGDACIHVSCSDMLGSIGLFETGKHIIMTKYQQIND